MCPRRPRLGSVQASTLAHVLAPALAPAMTGKRPTITDVARHAGVSKATVSAVLNDSSAVKDSTRGRVLHAIELLNYRPSQSVGRAATRKSRCIAVLIKEHDNPYYAGIVDGVRAAVETQGYTLLVASSK